jgi:hypothetical protein
MDTSNRRMTMNTVKHIKIDRDTIIEHLLASWQDHYDMMDDDFLIDEYKEYISQDPDYPVIIELIEEQA